MAAFEFIGPDHPFAPQISCLRDALSAEPPRPSDANVATRSLLRIDRSAPKPRLKWAYVSRQLSTAQPGHFEAVTLLHRTGGARVDRYEFPRDPKLNGLAAPLRELPPPCQVLRYVPRRRLTIATRDHIAKFVRARDLAATLARLNSVENIFNNCSGIRVPRILSSRPEAGVFFEERLEGEPLPSKINMGTFTDHLEIAGRVAAVIHSQEADGLPKMVPQQLVEVAARDQALITLFRPELAKWLGAVFTEIASRISNFDEETVACHGDFRAPHLLTTPAGGWSVVDFDGAVAGDPHWEHALFITSLKRELPMFADGDLHETAADAYLRGYEQERGRVNRDKQRWFRLAAELHFLARTFQRDLYTPRLFAQSVCAIGKLSGVGAP